MACLGRIGCGLLLIVLGAVGWHFRDAWLPRLRAIVSAEMPLDQAEWSVITADGGRRAHEQVQQLRHRTGPAYVNIDGADFVAYTLSGGLTEILKVDSVPEALVENGQVYLRIRIRLADLGGRESLGAVAAMFSEAEDVTIAGQLQAIRPGLAQFLPTDVAVRDLKMPPGVLSRLLRQWSPGPRPDGVSTDALPIVLPEYVADLRIAPGRVTLYKQTQ